MLLPEQAMASLMSATAKGDNGTRVICLFLRRMPGCVHMASGRLSRAGVLLLRAERREAGDMALVLYQWR